MKGIFMKIKTVICIFAFITMPFVNADPADDCKAFLKRKYSVFITNRAMKLFPDYFGKSEGELQGLKINGAIGYMIGWILEYKRGLSAASNSSVAVSVSAPQPSTSGYASEASASAPAVSAYSDGNGDLSEEEAIQIAIALSIESSAPREDDGPFVPKKDENPYFGETPDKLLAMSNADPSLNANPLFNEALNKALEGDVCLLNDPGIISLYEAFPLETILKDEDSFKFFREMLLDLQAEFASKSDICELRHEHLRSLLCKTNFIPVKTPGYGNCLLAAVVISKMAKYERYEIACNGPAFEAYIEHNSRALREKIGIELQITEGMDETAKDELIAAKDCFGKGAPEYLLLEYLKYIAPYFKQEIVTFCYDFINQDSDVQDVMAVCFASDGIRTQFNGEDEALRCIKEHPDALFICHNGVDHFLGLRQK